MIPQIAGLSMDQPKGDTKTHLKPVEVAYAGRQMCQSVA